MLGLPTTKEAAMIAVTGAAGNVGSKVADLLLDDDQPVRAMEHRRPLEVLARRGAEIVTGDLADPGDLGLVLKDAQAALVLLPDVVTDPAFTATRSRMARAIAEAIGRSRVGHVVVLSTLDAGREDAAGPAAGLRELEQLLAGLPDRDVLVLRSPFYMENLLVGVPLIRSQGVNGSAVDPDLPLPMIATRDVAAEAAERLRHRDFTGHGIRVLVGPEDVSLRAATLALGRRLGLGEVPYVQFPPADVTGALAGAGLSQDAAAAMVDLQIGLNARGSFADVRLAADVVGPTRLERFLEGVA
jgi:uncharacterized protein YbjT (DUF2867 family)